MTDEPMDPGELQMVREALGLTGDQLAAYLEVSPRTVRAWEAGKYAIPNGVREQVEELEAMTGDVVDQLVALLNDAADPAVRLYRTDAGFHAEHPEYPGLGARWWRHAVYRAASEVPGVVIVGE